ncbi:o-methyltransferase [Botrytis cinerea]|uniref:Similar to similar to cercosporin toxin biosynthesis protein n=1 Tax=Botryotinia fuckeliana (strain T4) TaxID=999810 RepID=G2YIQ7_BOTF4|nr:similar to similar to cercosporin toxin biosynthesis protein [Botrytis cinerea T4]
MAMVNREVGLESSHIVDAFIWWDSIRTFVDVGGSLEEVSIALANSFPRLHFTSQDLPVAVDQASISVSQDISNRVTFMIHDFFTEQPVMGADILQRLIPELKPGARIVIAEYIVPPPGSVSKYKERSMGLAMAELLNAKERDLDEWKILLKNADENFDFIGMEQPKDSKLYFIEARWNLSKLKSLSLLEAS